jgi:hypothetical protein
MLAVDAGVSTVSRNLCFNDILNWVNKLCAINACRHHDAVRIHGPIGPIGQHASDVSLRR